MKYFWVVVTLLFLHDVKAQTLSVSDVKISVKAESATSAREQAIIQAHGLAFQKLMQENFPKHPLLLPPQEAINHMVNDFSIDQEKSTPTHYTASLTFQFDESKVIAWMKHNQQNMENKREDSSDSQALGTGRALKILASFGTHREWLYIKRTLEKCAGVQNLSVCAVSLRNAAFEIHYPGPLDELEKTLRQKNIRLSQEKNEWMIALNK